MPPTPNWTDAPQHDPGITLLQLLAYLDDALSYYQDAVAEDQRLRTRRRLVFAMVGLVALLFVWCRRPRAGDD